MNKYTPGPWIWQPMQGDDMPKLFNANGTHICDFGNDRTYYPTAGTPPDTEDARLIAAAPELLNALRAMLVATDSKETEAFEGHYATYLITVAIPRAIAAIAKATGETK
jgi:hypothetical protein